MNACSDEEKARAARCVIWRSQTASTCGAYRYTLDRVLREDRGRRIVWVMLNPSTADGRKDDATMRRVIWFSARWGCAYSAIEVVNLYAYRTTLPTDLVRVARERDVVGPENDDWISTAFRRAHETMGTVVLAWGAHPMAAARRPTILRLARKAGIRDLHCIARTAMGAPQHPLRVRSDAELDVWCTV